MRLIGDDADLYSAELGVELEGDGTKTLKGMAGIQNTGIGEYLITSKAKTGSAFGNLEPGTVFISRTGEEKLKAEDKCRQLINLNQVAAVVSWSIDLSANEVEVTTLRDDTKKYRTGKLDATGTIKGQFETDAVKSGVGIQNRFFDIIIRKSDGNHTLVQKKEGALFIKGYLQSAETEQADKIYLYAQIIPSAMKLGADLGAAQEFDASFRLAGDLRLKLYYEEK